MDDDKNNIIYNDNRNIYNLKTKSIKGPNGEIIEPARYLDAEPIMNKLGDESELTKEQLKELKAKLQSGIEKTSTSLTYDDLMQNYITSSSEQIREFALEELKKRIDTLSKDELYNQIVDYWNKRRREYLQSVAQSKGNVR